MVAVWAAASTMAAATLAPVGPASASSPTSSSCTISNKVRSHSAGCGLNFPAQAVAWCSKVKRARLAAMVGSLPWPSKTATSTLCWLSGNTKWFSWLTQLKAVAPASGRVHPPDRCRSGTSSLAASTKVASGMGPGFHGLWTSAVLVASMAPMPCSKAAAQLKRAFLGGVSTPPLPPCSLGRSAWRFSTIGSIGAGVAFSCTAASMAVVAPSPAVPLAARAEMGVLTAGVSSGPAGACATAGAATSRPAKASAASWMDRRAERGLMIRRDRVGDKRACGPGLGVSWLDADHSARHMPGFTWGGLATLRSTGRGAEFGFVAHHTLCSSCSDFQVPLDRCPNCGEVQRWLEPGCVTAVIGAAVRTLRARAPAGEVLPTETSTGTRVCTARGPGSEAWRCNAGAGSFAEPTGTDMVSTGRDTGTDPCRSGGRDTAPKWPMPVLC
mmetsp:Transcript_105668/g.294188  ORF Transcript_105668/g.294188 Transcript_105668/m.294188 type:complete len:441 (+) Transcript_105668:622-1944(+)